MDRTGAPSITWVHLGLLTNATTGAPCAITSGDPSQLRFFFTKVVLLAFFFLAGHVYAIPHTTAVRNGAAERKISLAPSQRQTGGARSLVANKCARISRLPCACPLGQKAAAGCSGWYKGLRGADRCLFGWGAGRLSSYARAAARSGETHWPLATGERGFPLLLQSAAPGRATRCF
jgi:hypothetical protein